MDDRVFIRVLWSRLLAGLAGIVAAALLVAWVTMTDKGGLMTMAGLAASAIAMVGGAATLFSSFREEPARGRLASLEGSRAARWHGSALLRARPADERR